MEIPGKWMRGGLALMGVLLSTQAQAATLYIAPSGNDSASGTSAAPLKTLEGARDKIRALKAQGSNEAMKVIVNAGTYRRTAPFVLTPQDSGSATMPISYEAASGAKPVFSGSRVLSGWTEGADGLWTTQIPEVAGGSWYFEQLWVNGRRATRARTPNKFYFYGLQRAQAQDFPQITDPDALSRRAMRLRPQDFSILANLSTQERADAVVTAYLAWDTMQLRIADLNAQSNAVLFSQGSWPLFNWDNEQRYVLENVRSALDAPGEWFLSRSGTLYYKPLPGETISGTTFEAPLVERFIDIQGNAAANQKISNISFTGLTFRHGQYLLPADGMASGQAATSIPAAVNVEGGENITFSGCEVARIGGYAMWLHNGTTNSKVQKCLLKDMGAGGVKIGDGAVLPTAQRTSGVTVTNSIIHGGGRLFAGAVGVWIGQCGGNTVNYNDIGDFLYTGVSVGWTWGYGTSLSQNNHVDFNHIHHIGQGVLSDMGGVYTLGENSGTTVNNNHVHDVYSYSYGGWGLYNDEGTANIAMKNNLVYDTKSGGYHQHYGRDNLISNNIFALGKEAQIRRTRVESFNALTFEKNIVYWNGGPLFDQNWTQNITTRNNLYGDTTGAFNATTLAARQAAGQDIGSKVANPLFVNPSARDFHFQTGSPYSQIGFVPFEYSQAGVLTSDAAWRNLALSDPMPTLQIAPPAPPLGPLQISENFDALALGTQPPLATTHAGNTGSVAVSSDMAQSGGNSLKVVDVTGAANSWDPHFFYTPSHREGVSQAAFSLRFADSAQNFVHEWRDNSSPYKTGPSFRVQNNQLWVNGASKMSIPLNTFVRFQIDCKIGALANNAWKLTVTVPNQTPQVFDGLGFINSDWKTPDWIGFISNGTSNSAYYLDDLTISNTPPLALNESFETTTAGARPELATVYENVANSVTVIAGLSGFGTQGNQCLHIQDALSTQPTYNPHFFYAPQHREGVSRCSFQLGFNDGAQNFIHEWREATGTPPYYKIGPSFRVQNNQLWINGVSKMTIPIQAFLRYDIAAKIGALSDGTWTLTVTQSNGVAQTFQNTFVNTDFKSFDWMGFMSNANVSTDAYLDELKLTNSAS